MRQEWRDGGDDDERLGRVRDERSYRYVPNILTHVFLPPQAIPPGGYKQERDRRARLSQRLRRVREEGWTGGSYGDGRQSLGTSSGHILRNDEVKSVGRLDTGGRRGGAEHPRSWRRPRTPC